MSSVQVVDLRAAHGPAYAAIGNKAQRALYMERQAAARRTMPSRYAVNIDCSLPMPDGRVLTSEQPVDLTLFDVRDARALLATGVVMESLEWPPEPRQPWE